MARDFAQFGARRETLEHVESRGFNTTSTIQYHDVKMAISHASQTATDTAGDSDYGSDIDGDTWDDIFSQSQSHPLPPPPPPAAFPLPLPLVLESIEEAVLPHADDAETPPTRSLRLARIQENLQKAIAGLSDASAQLAAVEIEYEQGAVPSRAGQSGFLLCDPARADTLTCSV